MDVCQALGDSTRYAMVCPEGPGWLVSQALAKAGSVDEVCGIGNGMTGTLFLCALYSDFSRNGGRLRRTAPF